MVIRIKIIINLYTFILYKLIMSTWVVPTSFPTLVSAVASPLVQNGDTIIIQSGYFEVITSTLTINKELTIEGQSNNPANQLLESAGFGTDPTTLISITSNNVILKNIDIYHRKTTNTSVETALRIGGGSFPSFTYLTGITIDNCYIRYCEFGIVIRADAFNIINSTFIYNTGSVGNSNRSIGVYGQRGQCLIDNCLFDNSVINGTSFRAIYSSSTNTTSNETLSGKLTISNCSNISNLLHFYLSDNLRGSPNDYELVFLNNTINETSLFAGIYITSNNQADLINNVTLSANSASNIHGKGLFSVDGAGSGLSYRTNPMNVLIGINTLANPLIVPPFQEAVNSINSTVGFNTNVFPTCVINLSIIPPVIPTKKQGKTLNKRKNYYQSRYYRY